MLSSTLSLARFEGSCTLKIKDGGHGGTGELCHTHIIPSCRASTVLSRGITKRELGRRGGSATTGLPFAPGKGQVGQWVINKTFNAAMLAEALCMLEGFIYAPAIRLLQHGVQQSGISSM